MASEPQSRPRTVKRVPLGKTRRRLSFERRLRLWLLMMGLPAMLLFWVILRAQNADATIQWIILPVIAAVWAFIVSLVIEQITRPLQTLANVVAALREDDYSFRARGAMRNDAMGDLALEINALAGMLQGQRANALEAMALVERVLHSMQSPVLAFDPDGRLKLMNAAAEQMLGVDARKAIGHPAEEFELAYLLQAEDDDLFSLDHGQQSTRWMVNRAAFRLSGVPHTLVVLSDISAALREEERLAWARLIRVLGHEINNSLAPIKSIAEILRGRVHTAIPGDQREDFERGLDVIENRAESLNRFLQAYRQLMGLPAPRLAPVSLSSLVNRVAQLETRVPVKVTGEDEITLPVDADQIEQALINLVRNAAEAALGPDTTHHGVPCVEIRWGHNNSEAVIEILDNGPGLTNASNLFVPFYTTKPNGTGIGLALAQQIVQGHRGTVELRNRADGRVGCKAELRLPLVARETSA
ncbi:MAG TPA: ATP-binding protein [Edaphobacter sp.]|nr:ATP-binding protein [Edaphobacter sp.]